MFEVEEKGHEHRPHGTGFRWLDASLALSAFFINPTSPWLTIHKHAVGGWWPPAAIPTSTSRSARSDHQDSLGATSST
jgi:hypothetical protein